MSSQPDQESPVSDVLNALAELVEGLGAPRPQVVRLVTHVTTNEEFLPAMQVILSDRLGLRDEWMRLRPGLRSNSKAWKMLWDLIKHLEQDPEDDPDSDLPEVVVSIREADVTNEAVTLLAERDNTLFDRGGELVHVRQVDDTAQISPVSPEWLRYRLSMHIRWVRRSLNKDTGDWSTTPGPPPKYIAGTILVMPEREMFPRLTGIATGPIIRSNGTIVMKSGYDTSTGWMVRLPASLQLNIPETPTAEDVGESRALLLDVLRDFPFEQPCHRAAAFAYLFTLVTRSYFAGPSPMFLVSGTTAGAGKDLLVTVLTLIATGADSLGLAWQGAGKEEDTEKKIHSAYHYGRQAATWRNLKSGVMFESTTVDKCVAEENWVARDLGLSQLSEFTNLIAWSATGNNPGIGGDLVRRIYPCILAPQEEHPEDRQLRDIRTFVREDRGRLLSAALTIVRAYILAGKPKMAPILGTFDGWSFVRSLTVWAGEEDPVAGQLDLRAMNDSTSEEVESIHEGWASAFGIDQVLVREVIDRARGANQYDADNAFLHLVRARCLGDNLDPNTSFGTLMRKYLGKWFRNRRLVNGRKNSGRWWQLERREKEPE